MQKQLNFLDDINLMTRDCVKELLDFAIHEKWLTKTQNGYRWSDTSEYLGQRKAMFNKVSYPCPECGRSDLIHPIRSDGDYHKQTAECNMVYGRRGWRRLGDYDT